MYQTVSVAVDWGWGERGRERDGHSELKWKKGHWTSWHSPAAPDLVRISSGGREEGGREEEERGEEGRREEEERGEEGRRGGGEGGKG